MKSAPFKILAAAALLALSAGASADETGLRGLYDGTPAAEALRLRTGVSLYHPAIHSGKLDSLLSLAV